MSDVTLHVNMTPPTAEVLLIKTLQIEKAELLKKMIVDRVFSVTVEMAYARRLIC